MADPNPEANKDIPVQKSLSTYSLFEFSVYKYGNKLDKEPDGGFGSVEKKL